METSRQGLTFNNLLPCRFSIVRAAFKQFILSSGIGVIRRESNYTINKTLNSIRIIFLVIKKLSDEIATPLFDNDIGFFDCSSVLLQFYQYESGSNNKAKNNTNNTVCYRLFAFIYSISR